MTEQERKAFETGAEALGFDLSRQECISPEPWNEYLESETGHRWAGWIARALATPPAVMPAAPSDAATDEQIIRLAYQHLSTWDQDAIRFARAVLALKGVQPVERGEG